ncbi:MAG: PD40 domain-containing protein [Candidatus Bathyarchaeota archaeon]|nr:MAG: PD40 domain-containing protein [Candidatus Bathyarchaeota archaeon]
MSIKLVFPSPRRTYGLLLLLAVAVSSSTVLQGAYGVVPYRERWGIYELVSDSGDVRLLYATPWRITVLRLNGAGDTFVFALRIGGEVDEYDEICTVGVDGTGLKRLTENGYMDTYPCWSPDSDRVAFLSWKGETLDIQVIGSDGSCEELLYDLGHHDADVHWVGDKIVFTSNFAIWIMDDDGTGVLQLTEHPNAGEWGNAPLPLGDFDPRISPDGSRIVFERMVDDSSPHGDYDLYIVGVDGTGLVAITDNGWTQGMASWSGSGDELVYLVGAVGSEGRYDIFSIKPDGSDMRDLTSELFPPGFLAHDPIFSPDDSKIYFVGEWWDWHVLETTMSCSLSANELSPGARFTVSGSIEPRVPGAKIKLTFRGPDDSEEEIFTEIGSEGLYSLAFEAAAQGSWEVTASWEGDAGHHPSTSQAQTFTVAEPVDEEPGRRGIPGPSWLPIIIGLVMGTMTLLIRRRRTCAVPSPFFS